MVLSDWSETNLNTLLIMTCQTLQMWAKAKSTFFFFASTRKGIVFIFCIGLNPIVSEVYQFVYERHTW